jgi:hypothetical protein
MFWKLKLCEVFFTRYQYFCGPGTISKLWSEQGKGFQPENCLIVPGFNTCGVNCRYKESHSCTKLIVQALLDAGVLRDSGKPFSVAQVGRVLKQLGLERVRKKVTSSKLLQTIGSDNEATDGDDTDDQEEYGLVTQNEQEGQDRVSSGTDDTAKLNDGDAVDDTLDRNSEGHPSNRESKPDFKTRGKTMKDGKKKPSGSNGSNQKQKTCLFNNKQDKELQTLFAK